MELKSNLPSAVEETVEIMAIDKKYSIGNYNEYIADFISNMSDVLDSDSAIMVEVINADKERGLLSIRVTEEYKHPNGKIGKVDCERTVILNKVDVDVPETFTVKFWVTNAAGEQKCYKSYKILEGDSPVTPVNPTNAYASFNGWVDSNGYLADFSQPVTQDLEYYAVWN